MTCLRRILMLCTLLLAACASSSPAPTPTRPGARLPTRRPTPTPTATPVVLSAETYYEHGVERQRAGDPNAARRYFTWAIQTDARFASAYVSRASLHLAEGHLDRALRDLDAALEISPTARAFVLRAEVLRRLERYPEAWQAFEEALGRDLGLWDDVFQSRWALARAIGDEDRLSALSEAYAARHPDHWLRHYYAAWPSFASERYEEAIALLAAGIEEAADQPALLWYLLGRAYTGIEAWDEAIISLETARSLLQAGDSSLLAHTEQPTGDLFVALGRAYLGAGRCADAETMLAYGISVGASMSEHLDALEEARDCPSSSP